MACTEMLEPYVDQTDLKGEVDHPLRIEKLRFLLLPLATDVLLHMVAKFSTSREAADESCGVWPW